MFDSHAHLQDRRFDTCREAVLAAAAAAGVRGVCSCGTSPEDWGKLEKLGENIQQPTSNNQHPTNAQKGDSPLDVGCSMLDVRCSMLDVGRSPLVILPAFGVHPWYAGHLPPDWSERLEDLLMRHREAPVGEIGLDGLRDDPPRDVQRAVLEAQLGLAARLGRPVVLHGARAWGELLEAVKPFAPRLPGFVAHAFGGSEDLLRQVVALGGYVSFAGSVCNPEARRVRAAAAMAPSGQLLIETDAPDMRPPHPESGTRLPDPGSRIPGEINHPANLVYVARAVAELRGVPLEEIAALTEANARQVYGVIV